MRPVSALSLKKFQAAVVVPPLCYVDGSGLGSQIPCRRLTLRFEFISSDTRVWKELFEGQ